jgi:iron complex transport system permease protein
VERLVAGRPDPRWAIIFELRLPRTILAIAVGAALGLSGAVMQGYTRNPLADPGVLGVSSMAALGAVMTMYLSLSLTTPWLLFVAAMVGAGLGVAVMLVLAGGTGGTITFILAGVILNTVASAGVALALSLAPSPWAAQEIINWLLGSLADRSADDVWRALPFIIVGSGLMLMLGRALNALTLGETGAKALGIDLNLTRVLLAVGVGLASGASVAVTGMIGFVGLIVPHMMRPLVGSISRAPCWPPAPWRRGPGAGRRHPGAADALGRRGPPGRRHGRRGRAVLPGHADLDAPETRMEAGMSDLVAET